MGQQNKGSTQFADQIYNRIHFPFVLTDTCFPKGARGGAVGWDTAL
jgi:hypothetical protein